MRFRIQSLGCCLIVLTLLLFAGSAGAQDVSARCGAAMGRVAGKYSQCLVTAVSRYALHENAAKLRKRLARCGARFEHRTTRAINRYGEGECPGSDLVAAIEARAVNYAEEVEMEAHGFPAATVLFVQDGRGGTLSDTTLTLSDVNSETAWFTNRPYRYAGQITAEKFLLLWDDGEDSFASDPPNGAFTCTIDDEVVNYVVELTSPSIVEGDLSYSVIAVGEQSLPESQITCEGAAHLFIDVVDGDAQVGLTNFGVGLSWYLFDTSPCANPEKPSEFFGTGNSLHCTRPTDPAPGELDGNNRADSEPNSYIKVISEKNWQDLFRD